MSFFLRKLIAAFTLPVPISVLLIIIGLCLLYFSSHTMTGKILITIAFLLLAIFSTPMLPRFMLAHLEQQYQPLNRPPQGIAQIVVLGAGNGGYSHYTPNNKLSSASMARLIEAIRLHKLLPNSRLILSGGRIFGSPPDGAIMNNVATMLGVKPNDITIGPGSQNTFEEAKHLKPTLGNNPFILVTSANHMPRAMALFKHQGMHPIPAPTQLLLGKSRYSIKYYLPSSNNLIYSDIALHEYLGLAWSWLHGSI